ncbi:MAG: HU family DNA-binding protein [Alphaproteobacteria bacterium]|nr:HU family DNA-binding protein [Alphaproteobacteria bacterium]
MMIPDFVKLTSEILVEDFQLKISQENLRLILRGFMKAFKRCMAEERDLLLTGLGHFYICEGGERRYYNTHTGKMDVSIAKDRIGVAWSNRVKDAINKK